MKKLITCILLSTLHTISLQAGSTSEGTSNSTKGSSDATTYETRASQDWMGLRQEEGGLIIHDINVDGTSIYIANEDLPEVIRACNKYIALESDLGNLLTKLSQGRNPDLTQNEWVKKMLEEAIRIENALSTEASKE